MDIKKLIIEADESVINYIFRYLAEHSEYADWEFTNSRVDEDTELIKIEKNSYFPL